MRAFSPDQDSLYKNVSNKPELIGLKESLESRFYSSTYFKFISKRISWDRNSNSG